MATLTQKIVREYLHFLGARLRRNAEYQEYVLVTGLAKTDQEQTYFTTDLQDVIGTARIMLGGHENIDQAEEYLVAMGVK